MGTFRTLEEIDAWRKARELTKEIYTITQNGRLARDFSLKDQMRRAGISAMANIAEGFERSGRREFIQFLSLAKGSLGELRSHLYVALDQRYLDEDSFRRLQSLSAEAGRMIGALMNYLRNSSIKGSKFEAVR